MRKKVRAKIGKAGKKDARKDFSYKKFISIFSVAFLFALFIAWAFFSSGIDIFKLVFLAPAPSPAPTPKPTPKPSPTPTPDMMGCMGTEDDVTTEYDSDGSILSMTGDNPDIAGCNLNGDFKWVIDECPSTEMFLYKYDECIWVPETGDPLTCPECQKNAVTEYYYARIGPPPCEKMGPFRLIFGHSKKCMDEMVPVPIRNYPANCKHFCESKGKNYGYCEPVKKTCEGQEVVSGKCVCDEKAKAKNTDDVVETTPVQLNTKEIIGDPLKAGCSIKWIGPEPLSCTENPPPADVKIDYCIDWTTLKEYWYPVQNGQCSEFGKNFPPLEKSINCNRLCQITGYKLGGECKTMTYIRCGIGGLGGGPAGYCECKS